MDDLHYQHPLNVAHRYAREAESFEKASKFEEASKCHLQAVEFLKECASIATFISTLESIKLQEQYHSRQEHILALKKVQFEIRQHFLSHKKKQMAQAQSEFDAVEDNKKQSLQWAIFKNIEAVDSLIETLIDRDVKSETEDASNDLRRSPSYNTGVKHPKNDSTVIEELHTLNYKLRELISQLLNQLDDSHKEISELREQLKYHQTVCLKKNSSNDADQNLIDFNSLSSSAESIGIIP